MSENQSQQSPSSPWSTRPYHRKWLLAQADGLFDFFQGPALNPKGGFYDLSRDGKPLSTDNPAAASMQRPHGALLCHRPPARRPGSADIVDHGMRYLWERHRDEKTAAISGSERHRRCRRHKAGLWPRLRPAGSLLGQMRSHPLADAMLADITQVIEEKFWEESHGAIAEEFSSDWQPVPGYRGQNSNMHLTESLMAAFEATGERHYLTKAERIADLIINRRAPRRSLPVAEHFDETGGSTGNITIRTKCSARPAPRPATGWNGPASSCSSGCSAARATTGCRKPRAASSFSPWRSAGTRTRAASSTRSTGQTPRQALETLVAALRRRRRRHFLNQHQESDFHEESYRKIWNYIAATISTGAWRLVRGIDRRRQAFEQPLPGQGRHLPRPPGLPHSALPADGSLTKMIAEHPLDVCINTQHNEKGPEDRPFLYSGLQSALTARSHR